MKKTIALLIMAMFIFSLAPLAFAQDTTDNSGTGSSDDTSTETADNSGSSDSESSIETTTETTVEEEAETTDSTGRTRTEIKEKVKDVAKDRAKTKVKIEVKDRTKSRVEKALRVRSAEDLAKRHISEGRRSELADKYDNARERFKEANEKSDNARNKLRDSLARGDKNASVTHAKDYLLSTVDKLTNHLEKIKTKVQESENINESKEAEIVAEIDADIAELATIKSDVEAATTRQEIKDAAKKLHDLWKDLKKRIKLHSERVVSARVEGLVNRGLVLEKKLEKVLERLEASGKEVDVSAEVDSFNAAIAEAKSLYQQAQDKLEAGLPDEAKDLLGQARDKIKEAHEILKDIVSKIKAVDPSADISSDTEVEVEETASTSAESAETSSADTTTSTDTSTSTTETTSTTDADTQTDTSADTTTEDSSATTATETNVEANAST